MNNILCDEFVSAIIPVYNRSVFLEEAVQSVLNQTYRPIEIIIVDDGSTDGTADTADSLATRYSDIIRVIHQANKGPGLAREAGRKFATGTYIQYLDSDDLLMPGKFTLQVQALKEHPECGIAYGITRLIDENDSTLEEPYKLSGESMQYIFPNLLVERWWNTHTPLYRRTVCDKIGPWPDMRMSEDWLYDAWAGKLKIKLVHVPEVVSEHRQHREERLTGGGMSKSKICDISRLILELYACAEELNIPKSCPEMRHLSRWAFLVARQCGAKGLTANAEKCFQVAWQAAECHDRSLKVAKWMSRLFGWRFIGDLSICLEAVRWR